MTLHEEIATLGDDARHASRKLAALGPNEKNNILIAMADALDRDRELIRSANAKDLADGERKDLSAALLDRLALTSARIDSMIEGIHQIESLNDPIGECLERRTHKNGLVIEKVRVPIGVIAIVYESRPNVTADAAALCFKAGNAVILRGGKEAIHSNAAIADALLRGGSAAGMPPGSLHLIRTTDRTVVRELVELEGRIDLIIPRGGEGLIRAVTQMARIPVIKHDKGVCQLYVDSSADFEIALALIENGKCQRPGVCNALETVIIHRDIAEAFLPRLVSTLRPLGVTLRGDAEARAIAPTIDEASEADWFEEYEDLILALRIVPDIDAAISHINHYGSAHSDVIVSTDPNAQRRFTTAVDSSAVYVNASTRFTDGFEFGMGAEIGISTGKLHARGPMGLPELTIYKYIIQGSGQCRT